MDFLALLEFKGPLWIVQESKSLLPCFLGSLSKAKMCEEQSRGVAASQARGVHYYALISFALQVLTMSASLVPKRPNEVDILPFLAQISLHFSWKSAGMPNIHFSWTFLMRAPLGVEYVSTKYVSHCSSSALPGLPNSTSLGQRSSSQSFHNINGTFTYPLNQA